MNGPAAVNADCLKLTSYFGERQRTAGGFAADALLGLYERHQVATSILLRGAEGFGARRHPRTDLLHRSGVADATALLGVDGTAHGHRERAAFFSRNAGTPMM
jgi:hypothetical protein